MPSSKTFLVSDSVKRLKMWNGRLQRQNQFQAPNWFSKGNPWLETAAGFLAGGSLLVLNSEDRFPAALWVGEKLSLKIYSWMKRYIFFRALGDICKFFVQVKKYPSVSPMLACASTLRISNYPAASNDWCFGILCLEHVHNVWISRRSVDPWSGILKVDLVGFLGCDSANTPLNFQIHSVVHGSARPKRNGAGWTI